MQVDKYTIHGSYGLVCMNNSFIFVYTSCVFSFRFPPRLSPSTFHHSVCPKRMTKTNMAKLISNSDRRPSPHLMEIPTPPPPDPTLPYGKKKVFTVTMSPESLQLQTNKSLIVECHKKWICIVGVLSGSVGNFPCPLSLRLPSGRKPPSLLHTGGVQTPFG